MRAFKRFTNEERIKIEQLLKENYSTPQIALALNRCYNSIRQEIRGGGGAMHYAAGIRICDIYTRKEYLYPRRRLSEEEKAFIISSIKAGMSLRKIRGLMKIGYYTLRRFLNGEYHKTEPAKEAPDYLTKIENLEMQIKILTNIVRQYVKDNAND